jgi:hypothetical protein
MFIRKKFVTNSSSTCFIAFGAEVKVVDKEKFEELYDNDRIPDTNLDIVQSRLDENYATIYVRGAEFPATEYSFWQSIHVDEIEALNFDKASATKDILAVAEKYGCTIMSGPYWGVYNSGH